MPGNAKMTAPVKTLYVRQPFRKSTKIMGLKCDLPHFYVNTVLLDQTALDKELEGPGKIRGRKTWKTIYEVVDDKYFKKSDVEFPKVFLLKCKQEFNVYHFTPLGIKKSVQQIGLEYGLISQKFKIKRTIVEETDTALKK